MRAAIVLGVAQYCINSDAPIGVIITLALFLVFALFQDVIWTFDKCFTGER